MLYWIIFQFSYTLGILFLVQVILAVLAFVFSAEVKAEVIQVLRMEGLVRYRDDMNLMNLIDWFQKTVSSSKKGMGMQVNMVNGL